MAPPRIGSNTFQFLTGSPIGIVEGAQDATRPGADGHATRYIGQRGKEYVLKSFVTANSEGVANALQTTYEATVNDGSLHTVVTDTNLTQNNVEVKDVEVVIKAIGASTVPSATHVVTAVWRLLQKK